ncbi:MAG: ABC transporter ATP-binding protein [Clostridia bacterium]|nr:ABC transporter ATP-binding protein [Clostridia bacterium]
MNRGRPYEFERVQPPKSPKEVGRYLREVLGGFFVRFGYTVQLVWNAGPWFLFLMSFVALLKGVAPVVGSLISKEILNELHTVLAKGNISRDDFWQSSVFYLLIFLFVYRLLNRLINTFQRIVTRIASEQVVRQVKLQIMNKSKELDLASFDNSDFYERMENANREAGGRPVTILNDTFSVVSTVIEFIGFLAILFAAPGLALPTLAVLAVSIPSAVINFHYRKKHVRYMRRRSKERRQMEYYSSVLVNKDLVKEVRTFDLADSFIGRYLDAFARYYKGLRRLILSENLWHTGLGILTSLVNFGFYVLIALAVFDGTMKIGDYSLYTGAVASVATCVTTLISSSGMIYEGTLFIDNLILFMKEERTVMAKTPSPRTVERNVGHTIEFRNVSFRYPGTVRDILKDINLTIRPGETVALVGLNGAGKTTLIKLLMRLYDPTEGCILLDGVDLCEYDPQSLYQAFGIIFQDFGKYAVSVEENIQFGDVHREKDPARIRYAAEQSAAKDYIEALPNGYETPLMRIFETNGIELSIGQWQKLAIARAFYADSDILILDEPTASLDPIAEQEIFNQFDRLREDKTTVFVSHRLSSATIADQIIVLEDGRVIENGTHEELMARKGKYFELFSTQAKRYVTQSRGEEEPPMRMRRRHPRT